LTDRDNALKTGTVPAKTGHTVCLMSNYTEYLSTSQVGYL